MNYYSYGLSAILIVGSLQLNAAESRKDLRVYEYKTTPVPVDQLPDKVLKNVEQKTLLWDSEPGKRFYWNPDTPSEIVTGPWLGVHVTEVPAIVASQLESGDHESLVPDAFVDELNIELVPSDESGKDDGGI